MYIRYRMDGSLFDLRCLSVKAETIEKWILEALFADDCALMAHTEPALQLIVNKFAEASAILASPSVLAKQNITEACARRKAAAVAPKPPGQFPCPHCGRLCRFRLGLHSHLRVHPCT
ncbi:hypothetical protein ACOMHN_044292 [Nucella lapillus]